MPTITDVAKRARVSTYTVSAVLNRSAYVSPELTGRVHNAVRDLDYTINGLARGLLTGKTNTVGMFIPDLSNPFYAKVVRGVEDVLRAAGYSLLLGNTYDRLEEQSRYLSVFRSKQVDGLLVFCAPSGEKDLKSLLSKNVPLVFVGRIPRGVSADSVSADNRAGTRLIMRHLLERGHRRIGLITGASATSANRHRIETWKKTLREVGVASFEEYFLSGEMTSDSGYASTRQLLALNARRPTAIFSANFLIMTGVLKAMREADLRCPDDIEVTSADDSEWLDVFEPPISTVIQPSYEMGSKAAALLLRRMAAPEGKKEQILLQPQLRIRVKDQGREARQGS
jgi:LacI family transcriptional regulator